LESKEQQRKDVATVIYAFFEAGKNKDLAALAGFHSSPETFSKFDENPPFTRQSSQEAFVYEQAAFANISDYSYQIDDLRIDILQGAAIATFYLTYRGMFVNDYSFEATPVNSRTRATMVLLRTDRGWKIAHEHLSRFSDLSSAKKDSEG
jgi:ketosteroid isomerase-like protein